MKGDWVRTWVNGTSHEYMVLRARTVEAGMSMRSHALDGENTSG